MQRHYGIYRGIVLSAMDPSGRGRVQVNLPSVLGTGAVWAAACLPLGAAANGRGAAAQPGMTAWVMFEEGSPDAPVCVGVAPR
jgi:hypothetical protein